MSHRHAPARPRLLHILTVAASCAVTLTAIAAAPAAAAPKQPKRPACPSAGHGGLRTLQARTFQRHVDADYQLYGCDLKTRRHTLLYSWYNCGCSTGDEAPPNVWLTGHYVAVSQASCVPLSLPATCAGRLRVVNLRTGHTTHRAARSPSGLLLKPNGSVAYVADHLVRADHNGVTVLDSSPGIDPNSLATDGHHLYWRRDGYPQVAPFN